MLRCTVPPSRQWRSPILPRAGTIPILCLAGAAALLGARPQVSTGSVSVALDDLVFVTQSNGVARESGCNSLSLFTLSDTTPVLRLPDPDPATWIDGMTSFAGFSQILALSGRPSPNDSMPYTPRLIRMTGTVGAPTQWQEATPIVGGPFTYDRALAVMPDDETLLVEEFGADPSDWDAGTGVAKYCLSEVTADGQLGPRRGFFQSGHSAFQIIPSSDGRHAHLLPPYTAQLFTIDTVTMQSDAAPIQMPVNRWHGDKASENEYIGSISPDERYVVTTRNYAGDDALGIVDLSARRAWLEPLRGLCSESQQTCGEVAFNHGPINHGVLALRAASQVALYAFGADASLRKLGRWPLPVLVNTDPAPLAWSGDGSHLIVGTVRPNGDEFLILKVEDGGERVSEARSLRGCPSVLGGNVPKMILTHNRKLAHVAPPAPCAPPTPSATSTPVPTATSVPSTTPTTTSTAVPPSATNTPEHTLTPTSTPVATLTVAATVTASASPTRRSTAVPAPVYLPLLLRERCTPGARHMDVALVIDASTSMQDDRTAAGRTKLAAAIEAARAFVDALTMPQDQAAVIVFNGEAQVVQALTGSRPAIEAALVRIPGLVRQQTRIDLGIQEAFRALRDSQQNPARERVMILLTDGLANPEPASTAVQRAQEAKDVGITIFTIGLGQDHELNVVELIQMASRPETFYRAPDGEDLAAIYRAIASEIPCPSEAYWGKR